MGKTKQKTVDIEAKVKADKMVHKTKLKKGETEVISKPVSHRSDKYKSAKAKVDVNRFYAPAEALTLAKEVSYGKFDGSIEMHAVIRRASLNIQVKLPHSTGKQKKVVVADDSLIKELETGKVNFDVLLATADMMPKLVKFAKLLGPRGLMPNPKNGTLIKSVEAAKNFAVDALTVKTEKSAPVIHVAFGKVSMSDEDLLENLNALVEAINPKIIVKAVIAPSMGPSVKLQIA